MSNFKRGLNRGLDSLLSDRAKNLSSTPAAAPTTAIAKDGDLRKIPVDQLQRGQYQPRQHFTEENLQELAESIRAQGVIQPIIVRKITERSYEIIAGERRWRAAQLAGLTEIPAVVRELTDQPALAVALIENIQRQDLNALEEAVALQRLMEEFKLTQEAIATAVGKSRAAVANALRLLKLNPDVKELLQKNSLEMGHARALLSLTDTQQSYAAKKVVEKHLSVRETERLVHQMLHTQTTPLQKNRVNPDPDIRRLENSLSEKLGAKVLIQHNGLNGKGKLEIHYHSLDGLDGILEHIK
jgi:ParB family chromosome partitioning protein